VLTDDGLSRLREASKSHVAQIEDLFAARLGAGEQTKVADLLERVAEAASADCLPQDE
jgi:hypothetical protein